jgi:pimeloyl-ACP methyl ester carboxylesterase
VTTLLAIGDDKQEFQRYYPGFCPDTCLSEITCPVLLLQGDPSGILGIGGLLTDNDGERAVATLKDVTVASFQGIGHGLHTQRLDEVAQAILYFLDTLE